MARRPNRSPISSGTCEQIHATSDGSYAVEQGDKRVLVGIIDTGVDGTHPDIAPNFSTD